MHTYIFNLYRTNSYKKGLSAFTNYCQMQEEIHVQKKKKYKNKEENKCYEKKDMFLSFFLNSKWSSFSGVNRKHIPQARSNDKKGFIACGTVSFGNVEPSMISVRTEVLMSYFECYAKQYQRKCILVKIHLNTG